MRNLFSCFIALCFVHKAAAQYLPPEPVSNLKELNLNGPVQRVLSRSYKLTRADEDTTAKGWCSVLEFDQVGNLLSETEYSPGGTIFTRTILTRPEKNTVVVEQFGRYNEKVNTLILKYDDKQELIGANRNDAQIPKSDFKELFEYDKFGYETKTTSSIDKWGKTGGEKFFYNDLHQKIKAIKTTIRHINDSESYFQYNSFGQLVEKTVVDPKEPNYINSDFKYQNHDQFGNWLNEIEIDNVRNSEKKFVAAAFPDSLKKINALEFEFKIVVNRTITYFTKSPKN